MTEPTVAVVGAGLGGLMLARILHRHGIPATIHELESSPTDRVQGGMLDIHEDTGQVALRAAGLYEEFRAIIHAGGQATRVLDRHGTVHLELPNGHAADRPEVERGQLRRILVDALPDGTVRWGAKVTAARVLDAGRHEIVCADGSVTTCDLLVGADGAWSRVRPLVSTATPDYTGVSFVEATLSDVDRRHPGAATVVGGGMLFALGPGQGFLAHREPGDRLRVYVSLRTPVDWISTVDWTDTDKGKEVLLERFSGWAPELRALVSEADAALVPRVIHALPIGHRWHRVPGVTLLGDAAHLMSPFAGVGANLALLDGQRLGEAIAAHPGDIETALASYENPMFSRSAELAAQAAANLETCFADDAPDGVAAKFARLGGE